MGKQKAEGEPKPEKKTNMTMAESEEEKKSAKIASDIITALGVYPSEMVEAFERQTSKGALALPDIPGVVRRWVNQPARVKNNRDSLFKLEDNAEDKRVGDLLPAYAPIELVEKQRHKNHMRGTGRLKEEQEKRREIAERLFYETHGTVKVSEKFTGAMFGQEPLNYKKPGQKTYHSVPVQIS
jgi:hypothetical protein